MTRMLWVLALLVLAVPATAAAAPYHVRYGGGTSQGNPLVLELAPDARAAEQVTLFVDGTCASGMRIAFDATVPLAAAPVSQGSRFDAVVPVAEPIATVTADVEHTIAGRIRRGGGASGTYRATIVVRDARRRADRHLRQRPGPLDGAQRARPDLRRRDLAGPADGGRARQAPRPRSR